MTEWLKDARVGMRALIGKPSFAAVAVLTLGVGIGANTAIASLVGAVLLSPLPFPDSARLVQLWETAQRDELELRSLSFPMLEDMRASTDVFEQVAGTAELALNLGGDVEPERVTGAAVTPEYFELLGMSPMRGRFFSDEQDRADLNHPVVVVGEALFRRRFGADPSLIGRDVIINDVAVTVLGVAAGPSLTGDAELFVPLQSVPQFVARIDRRRYERRGARWLDAIARVRPDVTRDALTAWTERETHRFRADYPDVMENRGVLAVSLEEQLFGDVQQTTLLLTIAVGLVLLVACANIANLLFARAVDREREMALRLAIGATRARLARQLMTESLLLSFLGGGVGLILALWSKDLLRGLSVFGQLPGYIELTIDARILGFTAVLCVATAFLFGAAPAVTASRSALSSALKTRGGGGRGGLTSGRGLLVSFQVGLAVLLTAASGAMLSSLWKQLAIDPGFQLEGLYALRVQLPSLRYDRDGALAFSRELSERLEGLAPVRAAALSTDVPLIDGYSALTVRVEDWRGRPDDEAIRTYFHAVSPGFFATTGIRLQLGRDFTWLDATEAPPVVIVNQKLARTAWPNEPAVGKRISINGTDGPFRTVVGVVSDVRYRDLVPDNRDTPEDPDVYIPLSQAPTRNLGVLIRADGPADGLVDLTRREIRALDAAIPVYGVRAMSDALSDELALSRLTTWLLGLFGLVALLLAALGLYGLLSHLVAQRAKEIGIQMALGAPRRLILRDVVARGLVFASIGIVTGLVASVAFGRILQSRLFEVSATEPRMLATCAALLFAVATLASYLPARRATRLDPVTALRQE